MFECPIGDVVENGVLLQQGAGDAGGGIHRDEHVGFYPAAVEHRAAVAGFEGRAFGLGDVYGFAVFVPHGLNAAARGDVVFGGGEFDARVVPDVFLVLHQPFAVAALSDEHPAVEVLNGTTNNLAGRGAVVIDEYRHGYVGVYRCLGGAEAAVPLGHFAFGAYDQFALGNEHVGQLDGFIE